ncbi:hypothetical protein GCM10023317_88970 [Actinopolymorpha pittospori]
MVVTWNVGLFLATWKPQKKRWWFLTGSMTWSGSWPLIWCCPLHRSYPDPELQRRTLDVVVPTAQRVRGGG